MSWGERIRQGIQSAKERFTRRTSTSPRKVYHVPHPMREGEQIRTEDPLDVARIESAGKLIRSTRKTVPKRRRHQPS